MKDLKVKILIGVPASGKSTWSTNFVKSNPNWVRINRDDFRFMLKDMPVCEPKIESLINNLQDNAILSALGSGLNVIIDNTNLKQSYINHFIDLTNHLATIEFQIFDISLGKAIERDKLRTKKVGEDVIKKMFDGYKILLDSFDFSNRNKIKKVYVDPVLDSNKENVILCDIDGTLAHMNGKRGPFDWNKVDLDDLDEIVADRIKKHHQNGEKVILVSGRDESSRKPTIEWLEFYGIPYHDLLMRPKGDMRKDTIIKKEIYENYIKDNYNVLFIYDDRDQVVKMWRELGLKVFQVEPGNF